MVKLRLSGNPMCVSILLCAGAEGWGSLLYSIHKKDHGLIWKVLIVKLL